MHQKFLALVITAILNLAFINQYTSLPEVDKDIFIYGTVYTADGSKYRGQIRWGKEEAFWFDHFNSSKPENEYIDYLNDDELDRLEANKEDNVLFGQRGRWKWSWNGGTDHTHQFICEFGNIKSITMRRRDKVQLEMRNGDILDLDGGSNDIGTTIQVTDEEMGHIKLDWDRVEMVEFEGATSTFKSKYGHPLYGTVTSDRGETFTGYVQWDHDERLAYDILDGETDDGDLALEFTNIKRLENQGRSTKVTTRSGRQIRLHGTNDVNSGNRGIIINILGMGRVDIPWDEFDSMEIMESPKQGLVKYSNYDHSRPIQGTVRTINGQEYSGHMVYDLDESYQFEILNGEIDDVSYSIPFHYIQSITPQRRDRSEVVLKSGKKLLLEDSVDVGEDHDGILVFTHEDNTTYISWEDVETITFN